MLLKVGGIILPRDLRSEVRQQAARLLSKVYVAAVDCGSPAHYWKLPKSAFITHISHQPTPTLDDLVEEVHKIASKTGKSI